MTAAKSSGADSSKSVKSTALAEDAVEPHPGSAPEPTAATVDVGGALAEVKRARRRARGAADVIQGIPIYLSLWTTLFDIERTLRDAERKLGGDRG